MKSIVITPKSQSELKFVSELLKKRKYKTLAPEAGTKPHVYYLI